MNISSLSKIVDKTRDILGLGSKVVAGVDIGSNAIKIAVLNKSKNTFKLTHYTKVPLPEGSLIEDIIEKPDEIVVALTTAIKQSKIDTNAACIGIFGSGTFIKILSLPEEDIEDIEDQISWDIEQYLPFTLEECFLSHHVLKKSKQSGTKVLVVAAKEDIVFSFKELVEETSLNVKIVDSQITALVNIFEHVLQDKLAKSNVSFLLMNIGAQKTVFIIYKDQSIVFTKEIAIGGVMITEEIQRQLGVNYFQAEELKIITDGKGNLPEEVLEITNNIMNSFITEMERAIDFYTTSSPEDLFEECFITGGTVSTPGLLPRIEELLKIPINVFNPFDKIEYNSRKIKTDKIEDARHSGVIALGLAMRDLSK